MTAAELNDLVRQRWNDASPAQIGELVGMDRHAEVASVIRARPDIRRFGLMVTAVTEALNRPSLPQQPATADDVFGALCDRLAACRFYPREQGARKALAETLRKASKGSAELARAFIDDWLQEQGTAPVPRDVYAGCRALYERFGLARPKRAKCPHCDDGFVVEFGRRSWIGFARRCLTCMPATA